MKKYGVIIVAGGSGVRMGATLPKQFILLGGKEVLVWSVRAFLGAYSGMEIVVVLPRGDMNRWDSIAARENLGNRVKVVAGGQSRSESVLNGLCAISGDVEYVAVHDGVRPLVRAEEIRKCFEEAEKYGSAVPVIEPVDSFRILNAENELATIDRSRLRAVQTPQIFMAGQLRQAYRVAGVVSYTDDASMVEAGGQQLHFCEGDAENIKITRPVDLLIAEAILRQRIREC